MIRVTTDECLGPVGSAGRPVATPLRQNTVAMVRVAGAVYSDEEPLVPKRQAPDQIGALLGADDKGPWEPSVLVMAWTTQCGITSFPVPWESNSSRERQRWQQLYFFGTMQDKPSPPARYAATVTTGEKLEGLHQRLAALKAKAKQVMAAQASPEQVANPAI
eukprot:Skav206041  [mRNA]  locus=scaffold1314:853055:857695:- [translate_table: standard]